MLYIRHVAQERERRIRQRPLRLGSSLIQLREFVLVGAFSVAYFDFGFAVGRHDRSRKIWPFFVCCLKLIFNDPGVVYFLELFD
jgi:hypothetical protein